MNKNLDFYYCFDPKNLRRKTSDKCIMSMEIQMYALKAKFWELCYTEYEAQSLTESFFYSKPFGKKVTNILEASNKLGYLRFVIQAEEGWYVPFSKQTKSKQTSKLLARIILVLSKLTTQAQQ